MSASLKYLTFASRTTDIVDCRVGYLHFDAGTLRAEYSPASEVQNEDGTWQYGFYINEVDLPGSLELTDVREGNIIAPYWTCLEDAEEPECTARDISCFSGLEALDALEEEDHVAMLRYDEVCDVWCISPIPKSYFDQEAADIIQALDYEAYGPEDELQTGDEIYVCHMSREFLPQDGIRISNAQVGSVGSLKVQIYVGGVALLSAPAELVAARTLLVDPSAYAAPWVDAVIPAGSEITVTVTEAAYTPYGTNYQGLRIAFLGRVSA